MCVTHITILCVSVTHVSSQGITQCLKENVIGCIFNEIGSRSFIILVPCFLLWVRIFVSGFRDRIFRILPEKDLTLNRLTVIGSIKPIM